MAVKFSEWNNELNYNYNYPSEKGFKKSLNDMIEMAREAEITHRRALIIGDTIPLNLNYVSENYSNSIDREINKRVNTLISEKELEKTNRMEHTKLMN